MLQRRGLFPCLMSSCYITNVRANTHHSSRIRFWFVAVCFLNTCKSQQCVWTQEAELRFQPWRCGQGDSCLRCACVHAAGWCTARVHMHYSPLAVTPSKEWLQTVQGQTKGTFMYIFQHEKNVRMCEGQGPRDNGSEQSQLPTAKIDWWVGQRKSDKALFYLHVKRWPTRAPVRGAHVTVQSLVTSVPFCTGNTVIDTGLNYDSRTADLEM